ncbi:MAG: 1-deoxy-D-xylulose-5-phosphate reductoisomerase [Pseudonocardiales bacterium]|nr:1-deoxy-D-xylulose-5-phosphate reductoisomerase [Pseudonocardiales bacterium]MBV9648582.1 1-deoxy-D-xylulose-5-phosphate reductoisomerase [Pseudonocardiales bacterium]
MTWMDLSTRPRTVVLLGSTGSIGVQALDVVRRNPKRFQVVGLAAGGADPQALAAQVLQTGAGAVAVARGRAAQDLQLALFAEAQRCGYSQGGYRMPRILVGPDAAAELVATQPADVVLNGVTGSRGLAPTLAGLRSGATLALANKESLVAGGTLVTRAAAPGQIVPVDSEHSALAQCLRGGNRAEVSRLVLTASGGPFRGCRPEQLDEVTPQQALAHPTWRMGPVVTVNSATLVNKGLELIEAHLLFDIPYDRIDVVVHPQSVIHSMVTFVDGSTIAQASPPDMRLPIALALGWPDRVAGAAPACDFSSPASWTFEPVDAKTFPAIELAKAAGAAGGCVPAVFNAANEEAVAAFLDGRIPFRRIVDAVAVVVGESTGWQADPTTVEDVLAAEEWARRRATELLGGRLAPASKRPE